MTIRPARDDEHTYIRETALKVIQPRDERGFLSVGYRVWEAKTAPWLSGLTATVLADDALVLGFVLEDSAGVQVLYVRRKFRGVGLGNLLLEGRPRDPVAVGFGSWSDCDA